MGKAEGPAPRLIVEVRVDVSSVMESDMAARGWFDKAPGFY